MRHMKHETYCFIFSGSLKHNGRNVATVLINNSNTFFFQFPSSREEWPHIAKEFEIRWNFPNCLGAVDGKHVAIQSPPGAGSFYYTYKGFHSLVLMRIANASYEFTYISFETDGRISDGGVIACTDFFEKLENKKSIICWDMTPCKLATCLLGGFLLNLFLRP
jgi:hypothetical protein